MGVLVLGRYEEGFYCVYTINAVEISDLILQLFVLISYYWMYTIISWIFFLPIGTVQFLHSTGVGVGEGVMKILVVSICDNVISAVVFICDDVISAVVFICGVVVSLVFVIVKLVVVVVGSGHGRNSMIRFSMKSL